MDPDDLMQLALDEAHAALAHDDVPIGAVVVRDGEVVGRGHNRREVDQDPTAHAEVLAIRAAAAGARQLAAGGLHAGRHARAVHDVRRCDRPGAGAPGRLRRHGPQGRGGGSLMDVLDDDRLNHRCEVVRGVREQECGDLLREFFRARR